MSFFIPIMSYAVTKYKQFNEIPGHSKKLVCNQKTVLLKSQVKFTSLMETLAFDVDKPQGVYNEHIISTSLLSLLFQSYCISNHRTWTYLQRSNSFQITFKNKLNKIHNSTGLKQTGSYWQHIRETSNIFSYILTHQIPIFNSINQKKLKD